MTTKPLADLSPAELRIRCAEYALGLKIKQLNDGSWLLVDGDDFQLRIGAKECCIYGLPAYDTDRNALMELILAVPPLKQDRFVSDLIFMLGYRGVTNYSAYLILIASPETVMRAFLSVMEEE